MLSKLLKYELKATGRIFLPFFLSLLVFAVITLGISSLNPQDLNTPAFLSLLIYIMIMVGLFVMTLVVMIQRFYRNLLSDEGYLMFTLPTKPWKLIASKLLVSMLWIAASVVAAFLSILIITFHEGSITEIGQALPILVSEFFAYFGASAWVLTLEGFMCIILSLGAGILIIYASIAIGHLFNKHKILASFGAFILLNTLAQILFLLMIFVPDFTNIQLILGGFELKWRIILVIGYGLIYLLLQCALYFGITNYILSKRLNLE